MMNKIWIELDKPTSVEHAEEQCKLANKMLQRLGIEAMDFWVPGCLRYNLTLNNSGMYTECIDNGYWFNLDKLAGEAA